MKPIYVLYHGNCYDGFGAALAAWIFFRRRDVTPVCIPVFYGKPPPAMEAGSVVYIVDFSYPAKLLLEMAHDKDKVIVLDHHATAQADLSLEAFQKELNYDDQLMVQDDHIPPRKTNRVRNIELLFDMNKSGAVLAWEFFFPDDDVPLFIEYLQDRDLWKFELEHSRAVSAYLQTQPMEFALWEDLMKSMQNGMNSTEIFRAGEACLRLKQQMVNTMAENARMFIFDLVGTKAAILEMPRHYNSDAEYLVPVANATVFFSEVGERLLELHPDAPFAAYYLDRADGMRQWGLRSRPEFDCSAVAKCFGGGGHKQAAGFVAPAPSIHPTDEEQL